MYQTSENKEHKELAEQRDNLLEEIYKLCEHAEGSGCKAIERRD